MQPWVCSVLACKDGSLVLFQQLLQDHCGVLHASLYLGQRQGLHLRLAACTCMVESHLRDMKSPELLALPKDQCGAL